MFKENKNGQRHHKVILIGNLGNDPDTRYTANGAAVANISLATTDSWKDKESGEQQDRTEWHRIVFFNRLAEIVSEYLKKGAQVYIEGRLQTRKWQDKDGNDRYTTEIVANEMQMLGSRGSSASAPSKNVIGLLSSGLKSVNTPTPRKIMGGSNSVLIPPS